MLRKGSKVNTTDVGQSYSATGKLLHWGFIGVFAYGTFKQVDDLNQLEDPGFLRFEFIFACAFLLILALRLWVMRGQGSALPQSAPDWQRVAAKLVYYGMYVALMMIAVTGLAIGVVFTLGLRDGALMAFASRRMRPASRQATLLSRFMLLRLFIIVFCVMGCGLRWCRSSKNGAGTRSRQRIRVETSP